MAGFSYTKEQEQVIYTRNRNLLVSASAGSGKTAVLVQRIIEMISNEESPLDIDKLLIVTFTNAAAAEMKHRIGEAIEKKIEQEPDNSHLQNQFVLLNHANIMTIHAFCLSIIKTYYNQIDLDPSFRIGDSIEIELIKKQVLSDLLEEKYEENDEDFIDFVDAYANGKTDEGIDELILHLYRFATSNLWPIRWLYDSLELLIIDKDHHKDSIYFREMMIDIKGRLSDLNLSLDEAMKLCELDQGPDVLLDNTKTYKEFIKDIEYAIDDDFNKAYNLLSRFKGPTLSRKRKGFDPELLKKVKTILNNTKDQLVEIKEGYFYSNLETIIKDINETYNRMVQLVKVVEEFYCRFSEIKAEKNIIDFSDIEHFALKILVNEDGTVTDVATEYRESFEEILIDEYQDSNIIQETILTSISKKAIGEPNVFMVGDVKQSIYKFRLAKPELFMEKYNSYSKEESQYQLINLYKNFRSRKEVINSINYVFSHIMSEKIGDITYDQEVYLYNGASYEDTGDDYKSEVLIFDDKLGEKEGINLKPVEAEAIGIANRIHELIDSKMKVFDKALGESREVMYKDIVILMRSTAQNVEVFVESLTKENVPVYANSTVGYFETVEIKILLNVLKLIDNPRQDLPLVSVLRSPIVGLNEDELAKIRTCFKNAEYYMAMTTYLDGTIEETPLYRKVKRFYDQLKEWRRLSKFIAIDELIYKIFEDTQFDQYVTLMPNGLQRKANIDMFVERAISYETTSFRGVFNFIQYIEKMKRHAMDIGEALVTLENENLVKIMTIHKSKGLEFPVVFVARMDKRFNYMDLNKRIVFHQDIGIGADYVNHLDRYMEKTLPKTIIANRNKRELLSEEMRIFYVALTRAREKLILTGVVSDFEEKFLEIESLNHQGTLLESKLSSVNSYMDWMLWGVLPRWDFKEHFYLNVKAFNESGQGEGEVRREIINLEALEVPDDCELSNESLKKLTYEYPYTYTNNYSVTMSVSDVKRKMEEELLHPIERTKEVPVFIGETKPLTSAEKGTIYHKIMYHLDPMLEPSHENVDQFLGQLIQTNVITTKDKQAINTKGIVSFLKSDLCRRMANNKGVLKKETPFVLGVKLNEMFDEITDNSKETVMLQGVIDAFFEEEGGLVLVDYKTDYIPGGDGAILIDRYRVQMDYYKKALTKITGIPVKEVVLYALSIGCEVKID